MKSSKDLQAKEQLRVALMQSRADAKKSQREMAELIGVKKNTVSNWENGNSVPSFIDVQNWFKVLDLPLDNMYLNAPKYEKYYNELLNTNEYIERRYYLSSSAFYNRIVHYFSNFKRCVCNET